MRMGNFFIFALLATNTLFYEGEAPEAPFFSEETREEVVNPFRDVILSSVVEWDITNSHVVAFYGHPRSRLMGIVGRLSKDELARELRRYAEKYRQASGRSVIPAVYLIYGVCHPRGVIGIMPPRLVREFITFTETNGFLLFLDHQIGRYTVEQAMQTLMPYMKYPHVHPALDPEWRTTRPMREIGHVTGEELNDAQRMLSDHLIRENIPYPKLLVIHQFNRRMIRGRDRVRGGFPNVYLIHSTSGIGSPSAKRTTHALNAIATNMPHKGFKLWLHAGRYTIHYDSPLMTPEQVMALNPLPFLIMYQ